MLQDCGTEQRRVPLFIPRVHIILPIVFLKAPQFSNHFFGFQSNIYKLSLIIVLVISFQIVVYKFYITLLLSLSYKLYGKEYYFIEIPKAMIKSKLNICVIQEIVFYFFQVKGRTIRLHIYSIWKKRSYQILVLCRHVHSYESIP